MAPTVQNNSETPDKRPPPRPVVKKSDLLCKVKYGNKLPDIPSDMKFLSYPFNPMRFIQYNPTSLERSYKFQIHPEHDLGINIDLVNKDKYSNDNNRTIDVADEVLLEEDIFGSHDSKRSRDHARSVSWLRRTEYISTEQTRFQPQTIEKVEAKVGFSIKKNFKEETLYMDRDSQMKAIEKTFEDNKKPIEKHYSKPNVHAVEVLDFFPDFKNWKYPCAQVIFDSDPAPKGRPVPAQIEEMSQAMIRGVMDESGEQFVAYFLPSEETIAKRREDAVENRPYDDDFEYDYKMTREYNWNVKSKSSKGYEENYFLIERPEGVFYNELETRVRLSKRRQKIGAQSNNTNTKLIVQHIPINEQEYNVHKLRENQLQPYDEEEEIKAEELAKKVMIATKESFREMAIKNKTDSDGEDSIKDESKKDLDDDVSDVDDDQETAVNSKPENSETVDSDNSKTKTHDDSDSNNSDKEIDTKSQQSANESNSDSECSVEKSSNHTANRPTPSNVSSGSKDKSDEEDNDKNIESSLSSSEEELKDKRAKNGAEISESDYSDVEMRSKKSSERAGSVANSISSITDNSDLSSNRYSDSE